MPVYALPIIPTEPVRSLFPLFRSIRAAAVPKNLGRAFPRMVRGFSRMAAERVKATTHDPKEELCPRKFAFDPRKFAPWLSRVGISEQNARSG